MKKIYQLIMVSGDNERRLCLNKPHTNVNSFYILDRSKVVKSHVVFSDVRGRHDIYRDILM